MRSGLREQTKREGSKTKAMYVDSPAEGFRTRVRLPPPPPISNLSIMKYLKNICHSEESAISHKEDDEFLRSLTAFRDKDFSRSLP